MAFNSLDDAMFWHGSLIGYIAGVKSVCEDEDKSSLLLRMADTQARLELMESENTKLRELARKIEHYERLGCHECPYADGCEMHTLYDEECPMSREIERMKRELGIEVNE